MPQKSTPSTPEADHKTPQNPANSANEKDKPTSNAPASRRDRFVWEEGDIEWVKE